MSLVSIVVNSCDDVRFEQFQKRFIDRLDFPDLQIVRISDAVSMSEGYNRGAMQTDSEWIFFCHDDIAILTDGVSETLSDAMREVDVFGPCGTTQLVSGNWYDSGQPYIHGSVVAPDYNCRGKYQLEVFGVEDNNLTSGIQALDGLFIACKRSVYDSLDGFDEVNLKGFHTYDIDFTFRAYLAGYQVAVINKFLLLHESDVSRFPESKIKEWQTEQNAFVTRFERFLSNIRGTRRHDVYSLNSPDDAALMLGRLNAGNFKVKRGSLWFRIFRKFRL